MMRKLVSRVRKFFYVLSRRLIAILPRKRRFEVFRSMVDCDPAPSERLVLKIADTQEELEACFSLLHDAYVNSGFMTPDPSGMRVTIYHALPTTTTLCAKIDDRVVGTISLIRESALGFPLQRIFDLTGVRAKEGNIAEVSALAVHPKFRRTGGSILFPLMKFMYEYCTTFFDTRHLVIAVNPRHIEMYESLLFFQRLTANVVENYDFVNGAPAVGAALDLKTAPETLRRAYSKKPGRRNLYAYFIENKLPNIQMPHRRFYTTNDPVLTPALLDYFFNQRTRVFASLSDRKKALMHSIYDIPEYRAVLPNSPLRDDGKDIRRHERFSVRCPGRFSLVHDDGRMEKVNLEVVQVSNYGFQARTQDVLALDVWGEATIHLGRDEISVIQCMAVRDRGNGFFGFKLGEPDLIWRKFVSALYAGVTHNDMDNATAFLRG
ncbi:MAG: GNAT family N-acetyltransferase [Betaproteobacteria bacterium]|jgi:GNAT superfamily N-acetyltransferase|nr:GNAT family N-acetyltransferase [Betaproteobacteria bacterium]MBK8919398.1 GNAT family N-acetyltransferase [Betaproteobacteria bacterium]